MCVRECVCVCACVCERERRPKAIKKKRKEKKRKEKKRKEKKRKEKKKKVLGKVWGAPPRTFCECLVGLFVGRSWQNVQERHAWELQRLLHLLFILDACNNGPGHDLRVCIKCILHHMYATRKLFLGGGGRVGLSAVIFDCVKLPHTHMHLLCVCMCLLCVCMSACVCVCFCVYVFASLWPLCASSTCQHYANMPTCQHARAGLPRCEGL